MPLLIIARVLLSLLIFTAITLASTNLNGRQSCAQGFFSCSPKGAIVQDIPSIGAGLRGLYEDVVASVETKHKIRSLIQPELSHAEKDTNKLCCDLNAQCLFLQSYLVPFCWDKFTTNFYLSNGSYGNISSGNFTTASGDQANLITGNFKLSNGQTGNLYSGDESAMPNTAAMVLPIPFTSKGVGSAIPASELGGAETYTTTLPGSVVSPSTVPPTTISPSLSDGSTVVPAFTKPASTVPGTTLPPVTTVVTRTGSARAQKTGGAYSLRHTYASLNILVFFAIIIFGLYYV